MTPRGVLFLLVLSLACSNVWLGSTACAGTVASFIAKDHGFEGPETLPAGLITLRLHNEGQTPHQLQLLRLAEDRTPAELAAYLQVSHGDAPAWAKHMGGPNGVDPGDSAEAILYLEPGTYVLTCAIPTKPPHQATMDRPKTLHVMPNGAMQDEGSRVEFTGTVHMAMFDYEFVLIQSLASGPQTFYVVNRGHQTHQVSLVRLNPGASTDDVLAAFSPTATTPLPGKLLGGMAGLEPDGRGMFTASLSPGRYAMMCLFPNPTAHDNHTVRGMVMNLIVE